MLMLTQNQQKVFDFLKEKIQESIPPTVREICEACGIKSTSTVHGILNALEQQGLISRDAQNARAIHIVGAARTVQVPILGRVTAGMPILAVEQIEDYIPFTARISSDKELFALRVVGESMIKAGILDGDLVVCERAQTADDGQIVVAMIDDEATVKRLYREKFGVRLQPENDAFDPIYAAEVTILGKVIASIRNYQ
ncbi:MAG: transcriptional repressor LexA [Clostridia bacterium]|nr:transcriptional repressor LexA [Clostridia bacterium]